VCTGNHLLMPAKPSTKSNLFDRFAEAASEFTSHAVFFIGCVLLVVIWVPSYFVLQSFNTWQSLSIPRQRLSPFLLVALLQNAQRRSDDAVHAKLDALADGLADLMEHASGEEDELRRDIDELRRSVGIEQPE
jgi:low affinity Fe/Cu permease